MSAASFRAAQELPDRDDADLQQPACCCDHCRGSIRDAVTITLTPWHLGEQAQEGCLCGKCANELREWLGDEPSTEPGEGGEVAAPQPGDSYQQDGRAFRSIVPRPEGTP